ncbi:hypothetical protein NC653_000119 [Populus alba x Populus x berolinensis]|uniref:Uncharacterized protein n=1 Tax=Populus alba x Populus x berolinensis TaxID=444605 RepID=A0AAD6WE04_9ROSI|nr:hypothetical protein NC653_000119 [Populus alba x Populus x berolinensis]
MPVTDLPPPSAVLSSSGIGTSTVREANGSPVANNSSPLDGFIVEDCSDDAELEEEQIDFTFSEEEDEGSSPSSPTPASSASVATKKNVKGSVFTRLSPIIDTLVDALPAAALPIKVSPVNAPLVDAPKLNAPIVPSETCNVSTGACSKGKEEATTVKKASSASVATKKNVKGSVFTRLSPIVDTLVDALPAAALPVKVSPVNAPLVDALKLNAPIVPSETCVA